MAEFPPSFSPPASLSLSLVSLTLTLISSRTLSALSARRFQGHVTGALRALTQRYDETLAWLHRESTRKQLLVAFGVLVLVFYSPIFLGL